MATEKQINANRENSKRSTGPRTAEGKARSAQNPITHGMTTPVNVLLSEDRLEYLSFSTAMLASLMPVGAEEECLAQEIIDYSWVLRRGLEWEVTIRDRDLPLEETLRHLNNL